MSEIIQYLSFSIWLISLSIIPSRFIHVITNNKISSFFNGWVFCVIFDPLECITYSKIKHADFQSKVLSSDMLIWFASGQRNQKAKRWFARAAVAKYHKLEGLKQQKFILLQLQRREVQNQALSRDLLPPKCSVGPSVPLPNFWQWLLVLGTPGFAAASFHPLTQLWCGFSQSMSASKFPSFYKSRIILPSGTIVGQDDFSVTDHLCNDPISKWGHVPRFWG